MSLIPQEVQSFEYYKNKLPLYLQQSYGFLEHYKIWYDLLMGKDNITGILGNSETLLNLLNIFDENYLENINSLPGNNDGTISDMLDKIGSIFGITRNFLINCLEIYFQPIISEIEFDELSVNFYCYNSNTSTYESFSTISKVEENNIKYLCYDNIKVYNYSTNAWSEFRYRTIEISGGEDAIDLLRFADFNITSRGISSKTTTINLNNKEMLLFIKTRIIKNNYDGSLKMINDFYKSTNLILEVGTDSTYPSTFAAMYLKENNEITFNIILLFYSGNLEVKSLGIIYMHNLFLL